MNEDKKWELTLFQILRIKGNVYYLIDDRHTYTDILLKIKTLGEKGLVNPDSFRRRKYI